MVAVASTINMYHYVPNWWVIHELRGANAPRAWTELRYRRASGRLSATEVADAVFAGLLQYRQSPANRFSDNGFVFLADCAADGLLTPAEKVAVFGQIVTCMLSVRQKAFEGAGARYEITFHRPARASLRATMRWALAIDKPPSMSTPEPFGPIAVLEGFVMCDSVRAGGIGPHVLNALVNIQVFGTDLSGPAAEFDVPLSASFDVMHTARAAGIVLKRDPTLQHALEAGVRPREFRFGGQNTVITKIEVHAPPTNVAFDVFIRVRGREHKQGSFIAHANATFDCDLWSEFAIAPFDSCDVIFRSSATAAAERTTDMFEVWQGELVYTGIPVRPEAQTRAPY